MTEIAIVIPTFNSARTLRRCLESIRRQTLLPSEVIVVDDERTSDHTRDIAESFRCRLIVSSAGMAESRNIGIETSTPPILFSVDSDMVLSRDLLDELLRAFDDGVEAVSIREEPLLNNYWSRGRALDKIAVERTGHGIAIRAFTRELYARIGGYDVSLESGEDLDFHRRAVAAEARVRHADHAYILHDEGAVTLLSAARKKYRYGLTLRAFETKHGHLLLAGMRDRLVAGVRIGMKRDPLAVPAFLSLKAAEGLGALIGRIRERGVPPASTPQGKRVSARDHLDSTGKSLAPVVCLMVTPATRWGSWAWLQDVLSSLPPGMRTYVVSYGKPERSPPNTRFISLPSINYAKLGLLMSDRRFLIFNPLLALPLLPLAWITGILRRPDVLIGNGIVSAAILLPFKAVGARLFLAFHGNTEHMGRGWNWFLRFVLSRCDGAFVNSETSLQDLRRHMDPQRIQLAPHWVDPIFFGTRLSRNTRHPLRVLFVGRLDTEKFSQCLRVARTLAGEGTAELWAVGAGPLQDELSAANGLRWLGYIEDRQELASVYEACDIVWAPADATYLSRPGVEALAAGCPVIVSDIPAVQVRAQRGIRVPHNLIPASIGRVVPGEEDDSALAFLRQLASDGIRPEMRQACRAFAVENHGPQNIELVTSMLLPSRGA